MKRNNYYHWIRLQRRYRNAKAKWLKTQDARVARKLDIIGRRLHALNRKWKLGIAITALSAWLAIIPPEGLYAQAPTFPAAFNLSSLNGSNGFVLKGIDANDRAGFSVNGGGDLNGDGIDDFLIGAYRAYVNGKPFAGETYVVFGRAGGFPSSFELSSLDGNNGFVLNGIDAGDRAGISVSGGGDVNGDGIDDLLIGASRADPNSNSQAGETYVVFGQTGGFPASFELSTLNGSNGFTINGINASHLLGKTVSDAGDVNGDGVDDILLNAPGRGVFVVFGKTGGFTASIELSGLDGFVFNTAASSVSGTGDINGDGVDDLVIGLDQASPNGTYLAGETYVLFGSASGFAASLDTSDLNGSNGFVINGIGENNFSGRSVSGVGDVNGDGIDDLLIGAPYASKPEAYVVFGKTSGFSASMELSILDGNNGFVIIGVDNDDFTGSAVSGLGDVNGDGIDDILIGAYRADPDGNSNAGETYIVFGKADGFPSSFELSILDGGNGFVLEGIAADDRAGVSVSGAGDVNSDGIADLIIGANAASPNSKSQAGEVYVVFGLQGPVAPTVANAIPDQSTTEDQVFNFMVAINTFEDINVDDAHILSAALDGGGALPSWLSFDVGSNTFIGTPTNDDVGTIAIEVTATDEDNLFVSDIFDLVVVNVNDAPVLAVIGTQNGDEGTEITFTASANDEDLPANTLTYSLNASSLGKGMSIDGSSGLFNWTPTEAQSGGHEVTVTVSDGTLTDNEIITITVNEVNEAPVLSVIGAQNGDAGTEISFTAMATDEDLPANTLTFSLDATSIGKSMTIDVSSGAFSWTPTESQSGTHEVTVTVSDGTLTDTQILTVMVNTVTVISDELKTNIQAYPNPVNRYFKLIMDNGYVGNIQINIMNLKGQLLLQKEVVKQSKSFETEIDVRTLNIGTYLIEVKSDDENEMIIRIIKN